MKHKVKKYSMSGKTSAHADAISRSQVLDLIIHERIKTTKAKGEILKSRFDRLVTDAKKDTLSSRKRIEGFLGNKEKAVEKFYTLVKEKLNDRNSGYTRIFKTLARKGDGSSQVFVMIVNTEVKEKESRAKKLLAKRGKSKKMGAKEDKDTKKKKKAKKED